MDTSRLIRFGRTAAASFSKHVRRSGVEGLAEFGMKQYFRYGRSMPGTPIYERDWDLFVVLDACRVDLLREVADEYPFLGPIEREVSVGSTSWEWMDHTFAPQYTNEMGETAYITGNPYSERLRAAEFAHLDHVWQYVWDDDLGTIPARALTDRAITVAREDRPSRLLVHYMQPHFPSVADPHGRGRIHWGADEWPSIWDALRAGEITTEELWRLYRENLRYVLDDVSILLDNVDAERVVISADHGNAMGERWQYGHRPGVQFEPVRTVPWCETSATDDQTHEPEQYDRDITTTDVKDRLAQLGYVDT